MAAVLAAATSYATTALAAPNCKCRFMGSFYQIGEYACIRTPNGPRLARCGQVENNTSWEFTKRKCDRVAAMTPAPRKTANAADRSER